VRKVLAPLVLVGVLIVVIALVARHGSKSTTSAGAHQTPLTWRPRIGGLGVLPSGTWAAMSSGGFAAEVKAQAAHDTARTEHLIFAGQIVQLDGRATVRIIDGSLTTLTVRVLTAPDSPGLVGQRLWINPTWVKAP
jgi:hypothetical protein